MAVQAQCPSHFLFLSRGGGDEDTKQMELLPQQPPVFLDFSNADANNPRKRRREPAAAQQQQHVDLFACPPQQPATQKMICLAQLQKRPTGLRLDFVDDQSEHLSSTSSSSFLSDELAVQLNQQKNEMDQFLHEQGERLRRTLAETRRRHYRALLVAAEAAAVRQIREKDSELDRLTRCGAELEDKLARLRAESSAWQAKAIADHATAAALNAQLQQATAAARAKQTEEDGHAEATRAQAEDGESAYIDPDRVEVVVVPPPSLTRSCRSCRSRPASLVLLPCRHLCLCEACEPAVNGVCPVCRSVATGTVQVFS